ncbi:MAG: vitamin K epoxide reductase family protein [Anaerolineae bacterium]|nr:vitamin K epoxide reductase family protein [Anaerolineae bacterium]
MSTAQTKHQESVIAAKPAMDTLRILSLVLIAVGIVISGYLSYVKLTNVAMVCVESGAFNCEVVQNSAYSRLFGIPIAWLGLATYLVMGAIILLEKRVAFLREYSAIMVFGINLFGWLFSMWLVYVQVVLLKALCPWCLSHEVVITILFVISGLRLRRSLSA